MPHDTEKIRTFLESFGYKISGEPPEGQEAAKAHGHSSSWSWMTPRGEYRFATHGRHQAVEALIHLLNDTSQTGAKIQRLYWTCGSIIQITAAGKEEGGRNAEGFICFPTHGPHSKEPPVRPTVNEAVNAMLLRVTGLEDPRGEP